MTVMGLGQFGGGLGVVRWLHSLGARVLIADLSSEEKLSSSLAPLASAIADGSIALRLGAHELVDFQQTDLVVANAAVPRPWENRFLNSGIELNNYLSIAGGGRSILKLESSPARIWVMI